MNPRTFRGDAILITLSMAMIMLTLVLAFISIPITSASVTQLDVTPQVVDPGDVITISGNAAPGEAVWISSFFELPLDVEDGEYSRDFSVHFLKGEKTFSVTAEHVKNIRLSISGIPFIGTVEYPLEGPETATNGIATLSVSFPAKLYGFKIDISGKKNVGVYGDAAEGATSVNLKVTSSIKVTSDSNGDFSLDINTEGIPEGEFLITAGEEEETVYIGVTPTPSPSPSPSPTPSPSPSPTPSSNGGDGGGNGNGGSGASGTTPTLTPSPSPSPTSTSTPIPTSTPIVTPPSTNITPTLTLTPTPSPTPTLTPTVTPLGDFTITVDPKHVNIKTEDSITYKFTLSSIGEFDNPVELNLRVKAPLYNRTYTLPTQYPPYPKIYTYTIDIPENIPPCTIEATIIATGGGITHTDIATVKVPGFEVVFAITGLLAVAYLVLRKRK